MKSTFIVRRIAANSSNGIFVMKEKTNVVTGSLSCYSLGNEWRVLTHIHGNLQTTESGDGGLNRHAGIIPSPVAYSESVRLSLTFPCYPMDMYSVVSNYSSLKESEGVSENIATIWMYVAERTLPSERSERGRSNTRRGDH